ncbi:hypothetical protein MYSTI_05091 [Myxococcus stipitatus DSM 14675]|uniref:Lipoprotein n=1 Tax=Myxococcus stipitatus (strain DSM 14675 / JCM 12634 / Mx s8) TaxID=1278073 RepID=L7UEA1_MYXSD|nr:hypothetical protein [Myxococcus stipitatus]AGC46378.1 hypothetical protein MYSTI_05091 [Myxococcus stipitatus DSM 14675]
MLHSALTRRAWRCAFVLVSSLATACGDDPPPPTPDPPQVALTVPEQNVAGTSLKLRVQVSGCEKVNTLNIYDRDAFLKAFPYVNGDSPIELLATDIPYAKPLVGIAASLSLIAEVVCEDGRKNTSLPQSALFFPVARVVEDPQGSQVYAHPLAVDGSGSNQSFLSCLKTTPGGIETLLRHNASGAPAGSVQVPTLCNGSTVFTPRHTGVSGVNATKKRWVYTPGKGAFTILSDGTTLSRTSQTPVGISVNDLTVDPVSGDAIVRSKEGLIYRVNHVSDVQGANAVKWQYQRLLIGDPIGQIVILDGKVIFASHIAYRDDNSAEVIVEELDIATGDLLKTTIVRKRTTAVMMPVGGFSPDGSTLFLGYPLPEDKSVVIACSATLPGCEDATSKWSTGALAGEMKQITTYANGTRVAAATTQRVWTLEAATGIVRNRETRSIDANGALHVKFLLPGNPSTDLFFLNGPAPQGSAATLPVELVGVDQTAGVNGEGRELFRYQVPVSMGAAFDETGRLWMRTNQKLLLLQPSSQYRSARPR